MGGAAFIDNNIMNILTGTGIGNDSASSIASELMVEQQHLVQ
ncbi:hypothetical protein BSPWISOXPB_4425 [uncultured Gammaproteobacteria bacterium]|nr:hypothetical protein BSPWISOXPB_4425 [uncultured Gammaproteobacteria bacterium]